MLEKLLANTSMLRNEKLFSLRGATEGLNLIAQSCGTSSPCRGDEMIVTEMEHHANIVPWQLVCEKVGATLLVCPTLPDGSLDREWISKKISKDSVKLISLTAISNTLGTINPVEEIITEAKQYGKIVVIDGAQSVPHQKTDFTKLAVTSSLSLDTKYLVRWV